LLIRGVRIHGGFVAIRSCVCSSISSFEEKFVPAPHRRYHREFGPQSSNFYVHFS